MKNPAHNDLAAAIVAAETAEERLDAIGFGMLLGIPIHIIESLLDLFPLTDPAEAAALTLYLNMSREP